MPYETESDLRYIAELSDIPLTGPDAWSDDQDAKLEAAETAESLLEAKVNNGQPISRVESLHRTAAVAYASYVLFSGAEHPSSAHAGDFSAGSGDDVMEVAAEVKNIWHDTISGIQDAEHDEGTGTANITVPEL